MDGQSISNVVFTNNLYQNEGILPGSLPITDSDPLIGDPEFQSPGGLEPADYIPTNGSVIKDKGIEIQKIPEDGTGLTIGLEVKQDLLNTKKEWESKMMDPVFLGLGQNDQYNELNPHRFDIKPY